MVGLRDRTLSVPSLLSHSRQPPRASMSERKGRHSRWQVAMTKSKPKTNTKLSNGSRSPRDRVNADMQDSFDEELEMEFDDERLEQVLADLAEHPERETLDRRIYFKELFELQRELVKLQDWVQHQKLKVVVIFEGRDAAGKGGVIKRIT